MVLVLAPSNSPSEDATRALAGRSPSHRLVGGVPVFDGRMDDAAALCLSWIGERRGGRIATANLDFLAVARRDHGLRRLLAASHLVVADGAPVMWLARLAGATRAGRIGGVDLVAELLDRANRRGGLDVALYGSTERVGIL